MTEIDKRSKKDCMAVLANPNSSPAEIASAQARIKAIEEWAKKQTPSKSDYHPPKEYSKTDYGSIPSELQKIYEEIKPVFKGYFAMAAALVDELQPDLDGRTRGQAVSAAVTQLVNLRLVKTLAEK